MAIFSKVKATLKKIKQRFETNKGYGTNYQLKLKGQEAQIASNTM